MKILPGLILLFILFASSVSIAQTARDFPTLQGLVTDSTGTLSQDDIDRITNALEQAHSANNLDGHIFIALSTNEWYLDEYVKDYSDYLQSNGEISSSGWLLYISTSDRKFSLAVQDLATEIISPDRRQEIYLALDEKLQQGDIRGAIIDAVQKIGEFTSPESASGQKKLSPGMLMFMGIAIITVMMMLRLRKSSSSSKS
ncbi:MAG: TPM domain-containing protein [bacterium]|nr:TPM domain-containing protein [bacterium]